MATNSRGGREQALGAGNFYGAVDRKVEQCGAIFTELRHASPRKLPSHSHELPFLGIVLSGQYGERYLHQERQYTAFTAMYRPAGVPHEDEIGPCGVRLFEIEFRPAWRNRMADYPAMLDAARDDCHGGEIFWLGMKVFRELRGGPPSDDLVVQNLMTELLASIARVPEETDKQPSRWLTRIVEKLNSEFSQRLTLDELSAEAGVHAVHLSRVFRKSFGQGIGDYVHRRRVQAACELMLVDDRSLADISSATGFSDQSHFSRVFRRIAGTTPAFFRSKLTGITE